MGSFAIGTASFIFAISLPVLYLVNFQIRRIAAWSKREEGPKDRVGFFILLFAIFGFAIGCFAQPQWEKANECKAIGQPIIACMFFSK